MIIHRHNQYNNLNKTKYKCTTQNRQKRTYNKCTYLLLNIVEYTKTLYKYQ